jgi:signal transduction histidine kinase
MKFSRKVFISLFFATLVLGTGCIWISYKYVVRQQKNQFELRYSVFTRVLGDALTQLDKNTEILMANAARVVAAKDSEAGLLSTETLRQMRDDLNVTHIFVVDNKGKFIRSTNEDPGLIPNAFSFCPAYRNMVAGTESQAATPIIHPEPEPKPFKFLFVANKERSRLLEVGVRVDFVAKTLTEALGADSNLIALNLYSPVGTSFGSFRAKNVDFEERKVQLPGAFPITVESDDEYRFYAKVQSSHPVCCQCDVSKTSLNGEYYYVLEGRVSKKEIAAIEASTKGGFLVLALANLILSLVFSKFLTGRLVKNIETAVKKVRKLKENPDGRIELKGSDEVAYLTSEFDKLLDARDANQKQIIEAEKLKSRVELAQVVAHNIKSPVIALEMMIPSMFNLSDNLRRILQNSIKEIKQLTEKLKSPEDAFLKLSDGSLVQELVFLPTLVEDMVCQKQLEFSQRENAKLEFEFLDDAKGMFVHVSILELKAIISNLVNNAVESYGQKGGYVKIELKSKDSDCIVSVSDLGAGIPTEYLEKLGKQRISFKGAQDRGLGLVHACNAVSSWKGEFSISSELGSGTRVEIRLPKHSNHQGLPDPQNRSEALNAFGSP